MVKIVSVVSRMNVGGVATLLLGFVESLDQNVFEHTLITGVCEENEIDLVSKTDFKGSIIYLPRMKRSIGLVSDLITIYQIRKILRELNPDIVHTHTSKAGAIGRVSALTLFRKPCLVHSFHGHVLSGYFSKLKSGLILGIEKFLSKKTDVLVADSKHVKSDLLAKGIGGKSVWKVVPPGIRKQPIIDLDTVRDQLLIPREIFLICWIGRFTKIKDPFLAVESFAKFEQKSSKKVCLLMVGDGELFEPVSNLVAQINSSIKLVGWKTDVSAYLAAADLLLLTSLNEGFGLVVAEAGWYGKPTLSTKSGGVNEFIIDGVTGFLVGSTPDQIAISMLKLHNDQKLLTEVGKKAKAQTMESYSSEIFAKKHQQIYLDLIMH
jgi:glycosyltransferase involved in cell wall biosynthesis